MFVLYDNLTLHSIMYYRKHTNFRGDNISLVKFSRGLIFVGKSSQM